MEMDVCLLKQTHTNVHTIAQLSLIAKSMIQVPSHWRTERWTLSWMRYVRKALMMGLSNAIRKRNLYVNWLIRMCNTETITSDQQQKKIPNMSRENSGHNSSA